MLVSIITFLLVLSLLILIHELGHFTAAKKSGILVEEFGFGLPPRLFGRKFGETLYSLNLLPFGGFVRLYGEDPNQEIKYPKRSFANKSKKVRISVILAGVFMNLVLGIVSFAIVYSFTGIPKISNNVKVFDVSESSPAATAGIVKDDIIRVINGVDIVSTDQFVSEVEKLRGNEVVIGVQRASVEGLLVFRLTPREDPPAGQGAVGVSVSNMETYFPPLWQRPLWGIYYGIKEAIFWGGMVISGFFDMFLNLIKGRVPSEVAGPVGIYALTTQAASYGIIALINFVGVLSINLAILNVFPFPALDGGRLLFIIIESVFGKRVVPKIEATIHTVGIIVLLGLIFVITANDIKRLVDFGGITGYLDSIIK